MVDGKVYGGEEEWVRSGEDYCSVLWLYNTGAGRRKEDGTS